MKRSVFFVHFFLCLKQGNPSTVLLTEGMILDVFSVMIPELRGSFSIFTRIQLL